MLEIIIWDENAPRMHQIHANLSQALILSKKEARIICNSEPPLLSRMGLTGRTPVIEVNTLYWEYGKNPETISTKQLMILLEKY